MYQKMCFNLKNKVIGVNIDDIEIVQCRSLFQVMNFTKCHIKCFNHKWYEFLKYFISDLCKETYIVYKKGVLIGGFSLLVDEEPYLYDFMILSKYQNQGLGKKTVLKIIELIEGYSFLYLYVDKENKKAVRVYKKLGFSFVK